MANRPDAWKHPSDLSGDRPKSVLTAQQDDIPGEETSDTKKELTTSENSELNKAKVNPWIESKAKDKEETNPNAPSGSKLFYHYPQHRVSPAIASETSGMSRPQTEPGRTRNQMFPDDVKTLPRQSVHDVASASTGTKKEESEEGWVMVEKSTSETVMPCDPEDESNVLVPSPNAKSEETRGNVENAKLQRTQMLLANKFGSTFKVLPEARDTSETGGESSGISGVESKPESIRPPSTAKKGQVSMGNIITFASSISKWKQRRLSNRKTGFATLDPEHRQLLEAESDHMKTEVPEAMMRTVKEEAYRIVLKTTQAYSSQIGSKHKLTSEAYDYLKELREDILRI